MMIRGEGRIVVAAAAIFASLFGVGAALHGLLADDTVLTHWSVLAVFVAAAIFVVSLTPMPGDER
jgi:hypothetical protein